MQDPQGSKQIFWVPFEGLKVNPDFWIKGLAEFLGVDASPEMLARVVEASDFDSMSAATAAMGLKSAEATSRFTAGGGQTGKWASHFSQEQVRVLPCKRDIATAACVHTISDTARYLRHPKSVQGSRPDV